MSNQTEIKTPHDLLGIIEETRTAQGLSCRAVAREGGVAESTYFMWMKSGAHNLTLTSLFAFLHALGLKLFIQKP